MKIMEININYFMINIINPDIFFINFVNFIRLDFMIFEIIQMYFYDFENLIILFIIQM